MGLVAIKNWLTSFYQSSLASYAPGIAAGFSAWCAVRGGDGVQGTVVTYFGNSNGTSTGWRFCRLADVAASSPEPRLFPIQVQVADSAPAIVLATCRIPAPLWVGRVYLFGMTMSDSRNELALWANGVRLTTATAYANTLVPGASNLKFGVQSSDACTDSLIGGAYSSYVGASLAEADTVHAAVFDAFKAQQGGGKALYNAITQAAASTGVTIPLETCYDSWALRAPFLTTPATLANEGTDLTAGDLTFSGAAVLQPSVDQAPNFTGPTLIP